MSVLDNSNTTGSIDAGEMTRVDETVQSQPLLKIKELIPQDNIFQSFGVSSVSILKMLSPTQTDKVMEMMAKGSYVRYEYWSLLCWTYLDF